MAVTGWLYEVLFCRVPVTGLNGQFKPHNNTDREFVFKQVCKLAKSNCYLRHICLPIRMEQLCSHWVDFDEI
jgi:hypothetical protein